MVERLPGELLRIVAVDATNVHHVGRVFRSLYNEDYPVKDVYQPEVLWREIQAGRLISALAFGPEERIAGYISIFKTAPNPCLWEAGNVLVVPEYAHTDISLRLVRYITDFVISGSTGIDGIFSEAVCCHYFSQFYAAKIGMIDCGLELDQLDGHSFRDKKSNKAGTARVSCVLNFREFTDPPEPEYLPIQYDGILRRITGLLRPRILFPSTHTLPAEGVTNLEEKYYASARTLKISVPMIGGDWGAAVEDIANRAQQRGAISLQVMINMSCPHIGAAVDVMRGQGFFFGGMAPRWFGTDGLIMQKLFGSQTEYDQTKLYTTFSRELLAFIKTDREAVQRG